MSNRGNRTSGVSSGRGTRGRSSSHNQPRDFVDCHANTEERRASNHASMVSNGRTVQDGKKPARHYPFNQRQRPGFEYRPKIPPSSGAAELLQHATRVKEDEITCEAERTCLDPPEGSLAFGLVDKDHNAIPNPQPISMDAQPARHMKQKSERAHGLQPKIDFLGGTDHALSNPRTVQVEETIPEAGAISLKQSDHASMVANSRTVQDERKTAQQLLGSRFRSSNQWQRQDFVYRQKDPASSGADDIQHVTIVEEEITCEAGRTCLDLPVCSLASSSRLVDKDHNAIPDPQTISIDAQSASHVKQKPEPTRGLQPKIDLFAGVDHELPSPRKLQVEDTIPEAGAITLKESDHDLAYKDSNGILNVPCVENKYCPPPDQKHFVKADIGDLQLSDDLAVFKPFDICQPKPAGLTTLKPSLLDMNKERRKEMKQFAEGRKRTVLRSGMVLLENYLSLDEQVKIVKTCQKLGLGPGGFYQPSYREGAQLRLKMMCLGKDWDPESSKYHDRRCFDDAKPPSIPDEFVELVSKAIKESRSLIQRDSNEYNADDVLPLMKPNICIVNFYYTSGRLGLHQDRSESQESLRKGLPVVSFSIGDSCDFLYGDHGDVDTAKKIKLKSGDVVLFGGKSRRIFHGVTSIIADTAPKTVLEETNLRQGRLNLTFREY